MKFIIVIILLLSILAGLSWYIAHRLYQGVNSFFQKLPFIPFVTTVGVLTLVVLLGIAHSHLPLPKGVGHTFGIVGGYCMGVLLYLLLFTVAADLIIVIVSLFKFNLTIFRGIMTIGVLVSTLVTSLYGFVNARQIEHTSYKISIEGKTDISNLKIIMVSDLHLGAIGSETRLKSIVNEINKLKPDVVCVAGDFFDTDFNSIQNPADAIQTLKMIKSTYGVYASYGNHDGGDTFDQMSKFLNESNIKALSDEYALIDNRLLIVGRLDESPIGGYDGKKRKSLDEIMPPNASELPIVVLDHNPKHINSYDGNIDLILCGHTHKGQVFPINLITNAIFTVDYGYYRENASSPQVVVSSGVGTWGMPMRVGSHSEIVSITFDCNN